MTNPARVSSVSTRSLLRGATFIGVATVIAAAFGVWQFDRKAQSIRDMTHQLAIKTLSEGVAVAVQGDVIARDYGSLEARLMQTMADIRVLSIMVTDQDDKVLSQVKRDLVSGQPRREEGLMKGRHDVLEVAAYHDSLTGLPNRTLLFDRMAQAIAFSDRHHKTMAVCYMDLDKFGEINTNYGHAAGDLVLKAVAERLEFCVRTNDTVARLGGDEFVVLLTSIEDRVELDLILHRIQSEVERPIELNPGATVIVGISIGVTTYPTEQASPSELIEHADHAMYQAKKSGTNRIFIHSFV